jgi:hypothetical protein
MTKTQSQICVCVRADLVGFLMLFFARLACRGSFHTIDGRQVKFRSVAIHSLPEAVSASKACGVFVLIVSVLLLLLPHVLRFLRSAGLASWKAKYPQLFQPARRPLYAHITPAKKPPSPQDTLQWLQQEREKKRKQQEQRQQEINDSQQKSASGQQRQCPAQVHGQSQSQCVCSGKHESAGAIDDEGEGSERLAEPRHRFSTQVSSTAELRESLLWCADTCELV